MADETDVTSKEEEEKTSTDSSTDNKQDGKTDSSTETDVKPLPFGEDPKVLDFIERQVENRLKNESPAMKETIQKEVEDSFKAKFAPKEEELDVPSYWAAQDKEGYKKFLGDIETLVERTIEKRTTAQTDKQTTLEKEASDWFGTSWTAIEKGEKDKGNELSADDQNRLFKFMNEYPDKDEIIDAKGRWNWKVAFKLMPPKETEVDDLEDRKKIAALGNKGKGGGGDKGYKTSDDFKKNRNHL